MVRNLLISVCGLLLVLNAGAVFCPDPQVKTGIEITSCFLALAATLFATRVAPPTTPSLTSQPEITPVAPTPLSAPPQAPPRVEAELVAFLALLQEQGRLVDFVREDVAGATDQQLGAAARVVHAGCRKVLADYFEISPLHPGNEGDLVVLEPGYDAAAHRLLGTIPEKPPYTGKLLHPGWVTRSVKLPRVIGTTDQRPWPVLAPAEVEVQAR